MAALTSKMTSSICINIDDTTTTVAVSASVGNVGGQDNSNERDHACHNSSTTTAMDGTVPQLYFIVTRNLAIANGSRVSCAHKVALVK